MRLCGGKIFFSISCMLFSFAERIAFLCLLRVCILYNVHSNALVTNGGGHAYLTDFSTFRQVRRKMYFFRNIYDQGAKQFKDNT